MLISACIVHLHPVAEKQIGGRVTLLKLHAHQRIYATASRCSLMHPLHNPPHSDPAPTPTHVRCPTGAVAASDAIYPFSNSPMHSALRQLILPYPFDNTQQRVISISKGCMYFRFCSGELISNDPTASCMRLGVMHASAPYRTVAPASPEVGARAPAHRA